MENASIFIETVNEFQDSPLRCKGIETIQVNLGYLCNKECSHCHIRAGPDRTEVMGWETMLAIIRHSNRLTPELVDITGGAPEMNPNLPFHRGSEEKRAPRAGEDEPDSAH